MTFAKIHRPLVISKKEAVAPSSFEPIGRTRGVTTSAAKKAAFALFLLALLSQASSASSHQLALLLTPTAYLVSFLRNTSVPINTPSGLILEDIGVIIAPECAGLRFFVIASFVSLSLASRHASGLRLAVGILSAYLATIAANTARIISLVEVDRIQNQLDLFPTLSLHLLIGSSTYFVFLVAYSVLLKQVVYERKS